MKKHFVPLTLLALYAVEFIWSGINPVYFDVWVVEALTSLAPVLILVILYLKKIRFSNLAYLLCFFLPAMHIIGAHYTFANVPFDWFNNLIGAERNMYDRVAHATVGLYAIAIIELLLNYRMVNKKWIAYSYAIFFVMALAAAYELFEWQYAISADPNAGAEVLGSQGDIWDAQKDMLMDTLGALSAALIYFIRDKVRFSK